MVKLAPRLAVLLLAGCDPARPSPMDAASAYDAGDAAGPEAGMALDAARPMTAARAGLSGVWGAGADDVWAVGEAGSILHYDGAQWTTAESPTSAWLTSVSGSASDDVWAVGESVVLHWDGASWSDVFEDPDLQEMLLGTWSGGRDSVFMVGFTTDTNRGLLRRWDGMEWSWTEIGAGAIWEVWGSAPDDVWFGGTGEMSDGLVAHGDGMAFEQVEFSGGSVRGIWGAASNDVWAAPYEGELHHWDGSAWTPFPLPPDARALTGLSGSGPSDAWAVGLYGMILHWDGDSWTRQTVDTERNLLSVWAASDDDAWSVGEDGILLHWDGADWRETTPATE